ncbi:hypothetical protein L4D06_13730 [Enterovibrio makurazakiensis]|uniref:Lipoprotein n=1 Tax=Enterovibrio gelatinilyticus TaxID=2899819 RepID=A0ABT5R0Z7_9GAMM|nr:hypothetical protein [Enterovibrio sp. ZSDZ42]MDD1793679.1 hypothetical protein [Enterovibrio sp. ZSDZ42]
MSPTRLTLATLLLSINLVACTTAPKPVKPIQLYSKKEVIQLSYCSELADTAYYIASAKLNDRPKQELINHFTTGATAQIDINAVERIYSISVDSAMDYATDLFEQCALKVVNVSPTRIKVANFCAQKSIVASGTYELKQSGAPKMDAYLAFASYKPTRPYEVIDSIYDNTSKAQNPSEGVWDACIDVMSE